MGDRTLKESIASALDTAVRPRIRAHAGDVYVVNVEDGVVTIAFDGSCRGCPAIATTIEACVRPALMSVPGVRGVVGGGVRVSEAARERIARLSRGSSDPVRPGSAGSKDAK